MFELMPFSKLLKTYWRSYVLGWGLLCGGVLPLAAETAEETSQAEQTPQAASRTGSVVTTQYRLTALAEEMPPDQVKWLSVSYRPDLKVQVLALEILPRTATPQGAVLLLHDQGQHPDWPALLSPLRKVLPDDGWYTLSISMPSVLPQLAPEREREAKTADSVPLSEGITKALHLGARAATTTPTDVAANAPEASQTEDEEPSEAEQDVPEAPEAVPDEEAEAPDIDLEDRLAEAERKLTYNERARLHIEAGLDELQKSGYQNIVVVCLGASADALLDWLKPKVEQYSQKGFAVILIDPRFSSRGQRFWQQRLEQAFKAPLLDLVNASDRAEQEAAAWRRSSAEVLKMPAYQQILWHNLHLGAEQTTLLRRLRQWLKTNAPGMSATQFKAGQ